MLVEDEDEADVTTVVSNSGFITIDASDTTVTIDTDTDADAGIYVIYLTYSLPGNYAEVELLDTHITVTVINACETNNSIILGSYLADLSE